MIVICGDSFCSADTGKPMTHFSELLDKRYQVINLARGGVSNTVICLQLKKAIELNPALIIFNTTDSTRVEFVYNNRPVNNISLNDIIYPYKSDSSFASEHVGDLTARYVSDVWAAFLEPRLDSPLKHTDKKIELLQNYFTEIFDEPLKKMIDGWILEYWRMRLIKSNIPYIEINSNGVGRELYQYCKKNPNKTNQAVYHTDVKTQKNFASELTTMIQTIIT